MLTKSISTILFAILLAILGIGVNLVSSGMQTVAIFLFIFALLIGVYGILRYR